MFENRLRAVEQNKNVKWAESPKNQSGSKERVYGGKDFAKEPSQVQSERMNV